MRICDLCVERLMGSEMVVAVDVAVEQIQSASGHQPVVSGDLKNKTVSSSPADGESSFTVRSFFCGCYLYEYVNPLLHRPPWIPMYSSLCRSASLIKVGWGVMQSPWNCYIYCYSLPENNLMSFISLALHQKCVMPKLDVLVLQKPGQDLWHQLSG